MLPSTSFPFPNKVAASSPPSSPKTLNDKELEIAVTSDSRFTKIPATKSDLHRSNFRKASQEHICKILAQSEKNSPSDLPNTDTVSVKDSVPNSHVGTQISSTPTVENAIQPLNLKTTESRSFSPKIIKIRVRLSIRSPPTTERTRTVFFFFSLRQLSCVLFLSTKLSASLLLQYPVF